MRRNSGLLKTVGLTAIGKTATSSASVKSATKIDGKKVDEERTCKFRLQLFWEKEDEDKSVLNQKIPYMVTINIPENLDLDERILAAVIDEQGQQSSLRFMVDKEEGIITFFPVRTGTVVLANEAEEEPEKPEKPEKPSSTSKRKYGGSSTAKVGGWVQINSRWKYQLSDGTYAANCWQYINNQWYSFDAEGYMRTGWYFENQDNFWYYLREDGAMATGWLQIEGKWYYFNTSSTTATGWSQKDGVWEFQAQENSGKPSGAMYRSEVTPDGYTVNEQGSWTK